MTYKFSKTSFKEGVIKAGWPCPLSVILRNISTYQWKNKKIKDNLEISCLKWPVNNCQYPSPQSSLKNLCQTLEVQLLLTANVQLSCNLTHSRWTAVLHHDAMGQTVSCGSQRGWDGHQILKGVKDLKGQRKAKSYVCLRGRDNLNRMEKAQNNKRTIMEAGTQDRGIATGKKLKGCGWSQQKETKVLDFYSLC